MRTPDWIVLTAVAMVLGTACASASSAVSGGEGSTSATPTAMAPTSSSGGGGSGHSGYGSGGGGGGGGGSGAGAASELTVTQANYVFSPSTFRVASGDPITMKNSTPSTPHSFTVTGEDVDVTVDPGTSQDVKIDLPPGSYPFICRFHEALGMTGTLTVT